MAYDLDRFSPAPTSVRPKRTIAQIRRVVAASGFAPQESGQTGRQTFFAYYTGSGAGPSNRPVWAVIYHGVPMRASIGPPGYGDRVLVISDETEKVLEVIEVGG
jgi:hypothetical protein